VRSEEIEPLIISTQGISVLLCRWKHEGLIVGMRPNAKILCAVHVPWTWTLEGAMALDLVQPCLGTDACSLRPYLHPLNLQNSKG